jgi:ABC-2 type transport system ATP-binding protein
MEPIIAASGLTKEFSGKVVVDRLDLAVPPGAVFALLGNNGAGKTTTIRILTGLLRPDRGQAAILGQDCWSAAVKLCRRVGYVPERPKYYDWMTVRDIGWFTAGFHEKGYLARYQDLSRRFQLDPKARLQTLSKGQYAKVALALALAIDPQVLILDEPTSGLDLFVRREFLTSMIDLAGEGRTILISSHQVSEVERMASHVAFIDQGRLILAASVDEVRRRVVRFRLRFGAQAPDPASLGKVLERNGTGKDWQAIIQDPNHEAVEALRNADGIFDFEEAPLPLEDTYYALLGPAKEEPS